MNRHFVPGTLAALVATAAIAGEPAAPGSVERTRGRLAETRAEEERLEKVLSELRRGVVAPVHTDTLAPATAPSAARTGPEPGAAVRPVPGDGEIAFERARVDALKARVESARRARADRPAPRPSPAPGESPAPGRVETVAFSAAGSTPSVEARPSRRAEGVAPVTSAAPVPVGVGPTGLAPADALRLADALLAQGDLAGAATAYGDAAAAAEKTGERRTYARARYGRGRTLERLGQLDEALAEYSSIPALVEAGEWGRAAAFAKKFIEWRRKLEGSGRLERPAFPREAGR